MVILEFDAMDAPASPLLAAKAGSGGDQEVMMERKTAAAAATTGGWEWEFATIFMSMSPLLDLAILAEEWPANPLPGETNAVARNDRQPMPRSGKNRWTMMIFICDEIRQLLMLLLLRLWPNDRFVCSLYFFLFSTRLVTFF